MSALSGAQSVDRALALLSLVGRHAGRGASLTQLVDDSGLNKPTVRRLLLALIRGGMVEQDETSRLYFLGEETYVLGTFAGQRFGLVEICRASLTRLSDRTQDTSFLSVRRDAQSLCLYREEGTYPVRTHALQAGFEHPLGIGAGSLAMLAALPDAEVEETLATNEESIRARYPGLPPERIRSDVRTTRERGYSLNPGLIVANSWGVGVAFRFPDGRIAGALSIAAIDSRMREDRQKELADCLRQEVEKVEEKLATLFSRRNGAPERSQTRRIVK
ncbi:IclR family transcriptional regulator [Stappia sp.]|uniref:IclR family transcriptional regulator n=1 Tax=Stappia sp. TaxID=1870903 RepID=UPI003A993894